MDIYSDIKKLKGVGPKGLEHLNNARIYTILDLLLYFPRGYEIISSTKDIKTARDKEKVAVKATVVKIYPDKRTKTGKLMTTILFTDGDTKFYGVWFNQGYVKNRFYPNRRYSIMGKVSYRNNVATLNNIVEVENLDSKGTKIIPKYRLYGDLKGSYIARLVTSVLNEINIKENLPQWILKKYKLTSLMSAIKAIHYPSDEKDLKQAVRRLKFQELFTYSLKILMMKEYLVKHKEGISIKPVKEIEILKENLPFSLTSAQEKTLEDILNDMEKSSPMNRLLQGDVGSGKTIIAVFAILNAVKNRYQGAIMAPTEILAKQHYEEFKKFLEPFDIKIELLTGSLKPKEKKEVKERLKEGKIDILIGTHALIQEDVIFKDIGIIVTDEQHRFGVGQRNKLLNKGRNIDILVMTATPIPRTLSLYIYGDLDVSIVNELPPGRKKIDTHHMVKEERDRAYNFTKSQLREGRQAYVVCPLVEENEDLKLDSVEKLYEELSFGHFKDYKVSFIHGKLPQKEKDEIMKNFKEKKIDVIISTTVIEVGINVPNSNVMIIENAERFGLAQLHQLRGRVGRGKDKSYCFLISNAKSDITKKRMEIMVSSNDGFFIAEEDLKLRGTGEIFGFRQSGDNEFLLSDIVEDFIILKCANEEAKKILKSHDENDKSILKEVEIALTNHSRYICFN